MRADWYSRLRKEPGQILEEAGYHRVHADENVAGHDFTLRLGRRQYPRFHVSIEREHPDFVFTLHLDEKTQSHFGRPDHGGLDNIPVVQEEMERIMRWLQHYTG